MTPQPWLPTAVVPGASLEAGWIRASDPILAREVSGKSADRLWGNARLLRARFPQERRYFLQRYAT